jgi:hypothetical protein
MSTQPPPPPPIAYQAFAMSEIDRSHLSVLAICYWVWGGFIVLISLISLIYIVLGIAFVSGAFSTASTQSTSPPPPPEVGWFFIGFGLIFLLLGQLIGWLNVLVGFSLRKHRRWLLCNIVAGLNCLSIPLGTVLGIFTFVVLARPAVKSQFNSPH